MARARIMVSIAAVAALAGCVPKREAPPAPEPSTPPPAAPTPPPAPPPPGDWRDIALTPGQWRYDAAHAVAEFGPAAGPASFSLACDRSSRQIVLARAGVTAGNALTIRTSFGVRSLPLQPAAGSPQLVARLPASDRLLDDIAFSRGRFTVQETGTAMLVVPAWAEPARVIEDCRG